VSIASTSRLFFIIFFGRFIQFEIKVYTLYFTTLNKSFSVCKYRMRIVDCILGLTAFIRYSSSAESNSSYRTQKMFLIPALNTELRKRSCVYCTLILGTSAVARIFNLLRQ